MPGDDMFPFDMGALDFLDLEDRYGQENAYVILRTLEQFEGVRESDVAKISRRDRFKNVFTLMKEGIRFQTRH